MFLHNMHQKQVRSAAHERSLLSILASDVVVHSRRDPRSESCIDFSWKEKGDEESWVGV